MQPDLRLRSKHPRVENANDATIPQKKQTTETSAEEMTTPLKLRQTRMEVSAGKIIRLEINIAPIIRIPTTIVTAVSRAIRRVYPDKQQKHRR